MLFADVVHSMEIAAVVGARRLREIMAELVERALTPMAFYEVVMNKAFRTLVDDGAEVGR